MDLNGQGSTLHSQRVHSSHPKTDLSPHVSEADHEDDEDDEYHHGDEEDGAGESAALATARTLLAK